MATKFDIEDRWPELFVQLDETQRRAVVQSLASAWHEGWTPNREDVETLTDEARGAIDAEEYRRRAHAAARRRTVAVARCWRSTPGSRTSTRRPTRARCATCSTSATRWY